MPFAAKTARTLQYGKFITYKTCLAIKKVWDKTVSIPTNTTFVKTIKLINYCTLILRN